MPHDAVSRVRWIERFAARLMLLQPRMHAVAAAGFADSAYVEHCDVEPEEAVESLLAEHEPCERRCVHDDDDAPSTW